MSATLFGETVAKALGADVAKQREAARPDANALRAALATNGTSVSIKA